MADKPKGKFYQKWPPAEIWYDKKHHKYYLYRRDPDGSMTKIKSSEGYKGLQSLQTQAMEIHNTYVADLEAGKGTTPASPPIEAAKDQSHEGYEEIGQAIAETKDDRLIFKTLLDAANAKAYEHNIDNPSDRISLVSVIHQWRTNPETIPESVKSLIGYDRVAQQKLQDLLNSAKEESDSSGEDLNTVLDKWSRESPEEFKDVDLQGATEQTLSEKIQGFNPKLSDSKYVDLVLQGSADENTYNFQNTLGEKQEDREGRLETLGDTLQEDNSAEMGFLTGKGGPNEDVWNSVPEDQRENLSPQDLSRMQLAKGQDQYKQDSFEQAGVLSGSMPQNPIDFNFQDTPTYGKAKSLWDEMSPDYTYGSTRPHDNRMHNLAAAGHALGSSSLQGEEAAKKRSMRREDLENIQMIHNMLRNDHTSKGDTVGYLDRLGEASRKGYQAPLDSGARSMGDAFRDQNDKKYKNNVLAKDLAQMNMQNDDDEISEAASLHDLLENQRINKSSTNENLDNQINSLKMLAAQNKIDDAANSAQYEGLRQNLWAQKNQIEIALRQQGMLEEAQELKKATNKQELISKIVSFGVKAAGAIALGMTGNPAAGIGVFAPAAANLFSSKTNSGGNSAQANTGG
jgi:hypothetical protein